MNLGKVKTFLIVLFLGINVYLVISNFISTRFFIDSKTITNTVEILDENGITVDEKLIKKSVINLKNIDTNNIVYTDSFKKANKKDVFEVKNDVFSCKIKSKDISKKNERTVKKEVKNFLKDFGFVTKHMKFGKVHKNTDGDNFFDIECYVNGYQIFDSKIRVIIYDNEFSLKGTWYEPISDNTDSSARSRNTVYVTSVLISMAHNEDIIKNTPFKVVSVDYGYLAGTSYGEGAHVTTSALPYYRIKDNKDNLYYYDAKNGSYLK